MTRRSREVVEVLDAPVDRVPVARPVERRRAGELQAPSPTVVYVPVPPPAAPVEPAGRSGAGPAWLAGIAALLAAIGIAVWASQVGGPPWKAPVPAHQVHQERQVGR